MKREKYIYELIDNYLYLISLKNMIMENYLSEERMYVQIDCIECLKRCMEFYDVVEGEVAAGKYAQSEADVKLEYVVRALKEDILVSIKEDLRKCTMACMEDVDAFIEKYLMFDERGRPQEFTKEVLEAYIYKLRISEENGCQGVKEVGM